MWKKPLDGEKCKPFLQRVCIAQTIQKLVIEKRSGNLRFEQALGKLEKFCLVVNKKLGVRIMPKIRRKSKIFWLIKDVITMSK